MNNRKFEPREQWQRQLLSTGGFCAKLQCSRQHRSAGGGGDHFKKIEKKSNSGFSERFSRCADKKSLIFCSIHCSVFSILLWFLYFLNCALFSVPQFRHREGVTAKNIVKALTGHQKTNMGGLKQVLLAVFLLVSDLCNLISYPYLP